MCNQSSTFFFLFQVTVEYRIEHGACIPIRVHTVVISVQHSEVIGLDEMRRELMEKVVKVCERAVSEAMLIF